MRVEVQRARGVLKYRGIAVGVVLLNDLTYMDVWVWPVLLCATPLLLRVFFLAVRRWERLL